MQLPRGAESSTFKLPLICAWPPAIQPPHFSPHSAFMYRPDWLLDPFHPVALSTVTAIMLGAALVSFLTMRM
jgi:hypothetical protein